MADRFRVLSVLGRQLQELGIPTNAVLRLAGLASELFQQTCIWLTTDEMRALYNAVAKVSGDQAIGLKLGAEQRAEYYSPIAIAPLFTRSFRDALNPGCSIQTIRLTAGDRHLRAGKECAVEFVCCWRRSRNRPFGSIVALRGQ